MDFPSEEEFAKQAKSTVYPPTLKWRDLIVGVIYRIDNYRAIPTKFGISTILEISKINNDKVEVWAPTRLVQDLESSSMPRYIRPLGLVSCTGDSNRNYYKYELM